MKVFKVFIGTPCYKWPPHNKFLDSIRDIMNDPRFECEFRAVAGDAHIERARAVCLANFLHDPGDWDFYLMVDWDIEFTGDDLYRACSRDLPIVGGPYAFKSDTPGKSDSMVFRALTEEIPDETGLLKCRCLAGGYTLVKSDFMYDMCKAYPELRFNENPDLHEDQRGTYNLWNPIIIEREDWTPNYQDWEVVVDEFGKEMLSEDYSFCERVNLMGETCYMDCTIRLKHWDGDKAFELSAKPIDEVNAMRAGQQSTSEGEAG